MLKRILKRTTDKKECGKCGAMKSLSDFYFDKHNNTYAYSCKICDRKRKLLKFEEGYTSEEKRSIWRKASQKSLRTHPERWEARNAVHRAIQFGKIEPALECAWKDRGFCESILSLQAHHYLGYEKEHWLDVIWLCPKHHREADLVLHGK